MPPSDRPVVAVAALTEWWDGVPHQAVRNAYVAALRDVAGVDAVLLPVSQRMSEGLLARFDGLLLTGSVGNVHPSRYGGSPSSADAYDHERDACALAALRIAAARRMPLLAICRGMQELAVAFGGSLRTLPDQPHPCEHAEDLALPRDEQYLPVHPVAVTPGGLLERIAGPGTLHVNSLHRQAVACLGPVLRCEARALDGVVEAVSHPGDDQFMLGVQWHPEWHASSDALAGALFSAFGAAVRRVERVA